MRQEPKRFLGSANEANVLFSFSVVKMCMLELMVSIQRKRSQSEVPGRCIFFIDIG